MSTATGQICAPNMHAMDRLNKNTCLRCKRSAAEIELATTSCPHTHKNEATMQCRQCGEYWMKVLAMHPEKAQPVKEVKPGDAVGDGKVLAAAPASKVEKGPVIVPGDLPEPEFTKKVEDAIKAHGYAEPLSEKEAEANQLNRPSVSDGPAAPPIPANVYGLSDLRTHYRKWFEARQMIAFLKEMFQPCELKMIAAGIQPVLQLPPEIAAKLGEGGSIEWMQRTGDESCDLAGIRWRPHWPTIMLHGYFAPATLRALADHMERCKGEKKA